MPWTPSRAAVGARLTWLGAVNGAPWRHQGGSSKLATRIRGTGARLLTVNDRDAEVLQFPVASRDRIGEEWLPTDRLKVTAGETVAEMSSVEALKPPTAAAIGVPRPLPDRHRCTTRRAEMLWHVGVASGQAGVTGSLAEPVTVSGSPAHGCRQHQEREDARGGCEHRRAWGQVIDDHRDGRGRTQLPAASWRERGSCSFRSARLRYRRPRSGWPWGTERAAGGRARSRAGVDGTEEELAGDHPGVPVATSLALPVDWSSRWPGWATARPGHVGPSVSGGSPWSIVIVSVLPAPSCRRSPGHGR